MRVPAGGSVRARRSGSASRGDRHWARCRADTPGERCSAWFRGRGNQAVTWGVLRGGITSALLVIRKCLPPRRAGSGSS